jgi:hypothetical protein
LAAAAKLDVKVARAEFFFFWYQLGYIMPKQNSSLSHQHHCILCRRLGGTIN